MQASTNRRQFFLEKLLWRVWTFHVTYKGVGRKFSRAGGRQRKKDRKLAKISKKYLASSRGASGKKDRKIVKKKPKIALLSLYLLYLHRVWKSREALPPAADVHSYILFKATPCNLAFWRVFDWRQSYSYLLTQSRYDWSIADSNAAVEFWIPRNKNIKTINQCFIEKQNTMYNLLLRSAILPESLCR